MAMNLGKESETCEFKEGIGQLDKGLRSLTAMLNRHFTGTVYFGVRDDGTVIGVDVGDSTLMKIRNAIRDTIQPRIICDIQCLSDGEGHDYISISAQGSDIPYSFDGRYYIRNVAADESVDNSVLRKMLSSGDADIICQADSPADDLTFSGLLTSLMSKGIHIDDGNRLKENYRLLNGSGRYNLMAYLLSDQNALQTKVVRFSGKDKTEMLERRDYSGRSLITAYKEVMEYMDSMDTVKVDLSRGLREEVRLFPLDSFREAWINACVHNNWMELVPPSVYIYDDRIEVVSYGGLPFGMDVPKLFSGASKPVNMTLMRIFGTVGIAEQSGHGVLTILKECGEEAFSIDPDMITVTIRFNYEPDLVTLRKATQRRMAQMSDNQMRVYEFLKENPECTVKEVAERTGLSVPGVSKILSRFKEDGLIVREGSKKTGRWVVI